MSDKQFIAHDADVLTFAGATMKYPSPCRDDPVEPYGTTAEFAAKNLVKPQTVRKQLCQTGSYFGTKPKKLVNGRLSWPLG